MLNKIFRKHLLLNAVYILSLISCTLRHVGSLSSRQGFNEPLSPALEAQS